jgi:hypothetical protein
MNLIYLGIFPCCPLDISAACEPMVSNARYRHMLHLIPPLLQDGGTTLILQWSGGLAAAGGLSVVTEENSCRINYAFAEFQSQPQSGPFGARTTSKRGASTTLCR